MNEDASPPQMLSHLEQWTTISQPPDEEEVLLFDKALAEG
jgi:hypothetical protein